MASHYHWVGLKRNTDVSFVTCPVIQVIHNLGWDTFDLLK